MQRIAAILLNKTYIVDCLSKKSKRNIGERSKFYVEDNHPAIIEPAVFNCVQEEMARRSGKQKVKKYSKWSNTIPKICLSFKSPNEVLKEYQKQC